VAATSYRSGVADSDHAEQKTLGSYTSVVWQRKWLVLVPIVLAGATALLLTLLQTPMYQASAAVLVRIPPTAESLATSGSEMSPRIIENELQTAAGSTLQSKVREIVGDEPTLSVSSSEGSDVFLFTATSSNADAAAFAANTYAEQYIESQATTLIEEYAARTAVLEEQIEVLDSGDVDETRRAEYERELEDLEVSTQLATTSGAALLDAAAAPSDPFEPDTVLTVALALGAGLLIGLAAAFVVNHFNTTLDDEDDLIDASGLPNMAVVSHLNGWKQGTFHVITREEPFSASAEAYRQLRAGLQSVAIDRPMKLVQVTSAEPGDGKTTTASNLAVTAARSDQRVVLIDCDLRTPRLHDFFDLPNEAGFTSVLRGETTLPRVAQSIPGEGNLLVITSGPLPSDPAELLAGESLHETLGHLGNSVDMVILDTPPVLLEDDALTMAAFVDGVILVASTETSNSRQVARAVNRLRETDAPAFGTVLNNFESDGVTKSSNGIAETKPPEVGESRKPESMPTETSS
jgi:capsular exopolysaccharide synthesis family protein